MSMRTQSENDGRIAPVAAAPAGSPSTKVLMSLCGVGAVLAIAWGLLQWFLLPHDWDRRETASSTIENDADRHESGLTWGAPGLS